MATLTRSFRRRLRVGRDDAAPSEQPAVEIGPNDPLLAYLQAAADVEALELDSPALRELKAAGVKLAVAPVSQGKLLDNLAAQAAPALRVGRLVRQQEAEASTSACASPAFNRAPPPPTGKPGAGRRAS